MSSKALPQTSSTTTGHPAAWRHAGMDSDSIFAQSRVVHVHASPLGTQLGCRLQTAGGAHCLLCGAMPILPTEFAQRHTIPFFHQQLAVSSTDSQRLTRTPLAQADLRQRSMEAVGQRGFSRNPLRQPEGTVQRHATPTRVRELLSPGNSGLAHRSTTAQGLITWDQHQCAPFQSHV